MADPLVLDPDLCYRAVQSRDARFDGRFYTAVRSTGIYCRPSCPARTPHRTNVRFYATAAGAEAAGYRPCLRCRPETAPGSAVWLGTEATVRRALRLIDDGLLDDERVPELARRLGVTDRHLRRLFREHVGAPPGQVAQTRRVHLAKRLIDETNLPMTQVAFAAGFASVRRFNAAVRSTYDRPPSALRRGRETGLPGTGSLRLLLPYRPPLAGPELLQHLHTRALPGSERVVDNAYLRLVQIAGTVGVIGARLVPERAGVELTVPAPLAGELRSLIARTRRVLDLKADPDAIAADVAADPILADRVLARPGLRVPGSWEPFETTVRIILGQQISVSAAQHLAGRLVSTYGTPVELTPDAAPVGAPATWWTAFPSPGRLAEAPLEEIGLFAQRADAIRRLSAAVLHEDLALSPTGDPDATCRFLRSIPGIGPWTTQYVRMRVLEDPDAFPASDLGLRKAAGSLWMPEQPSPISASWLRSQAEAWRPWRAYAATHLWTPPVLEASPAGVSAPAPSVD